MTTNAINERYNTLLKELADIAKNHSNEISALDASYNFIYDFGDDHTVQVGAGNIERQFMMLLIHLDAFKKGTGLFDALDMHEFMAFVTHAYLETNQFLNDNEMRSVAVDVSKLKGRDSK